MATTIYDGPARGAASIYATEASRGAGKGTRLQITAGGRDEGYADFNSVKEANEFAHAILRWVLEETEWRSKHGVSLD